MARKIDLSKIREAKNTQFNPNKVKTTVTKKKVAQPEVVKEPEEIVKLEPPKAVEEKPKAKKAIKKPKPSRVGRPVDKNKKPTRATSIRIHPDLIEIPKILAGVSRKNVFTIYNEMIIEALQKYQKKYPGLIDDLKAPPKEEI